MTPTEALARIEAQPLTLSTGQSLQDWLASETSLASRAPSAIREYRRFLALALCAAPGDITLPGPRVGQIWHIHRDDPGYAAFQAALGTDALGPHRGSKGADAAIDTTRRRYAAGFGPPPRRWWPSRFLRDLRFTGPAAMMLLTAGVLLLDILWLHWLPPELPWGFLVAAIPLLTRAAIDGLLPQSFRVYGSDTPAFAQGPDR